MPDYTLHYVYQLGDFVTSNAHVAPPEPQSFEADPFRIALCDDATARKMQVADDHGELEELGDCGQVLTAPMTLDNVTYPAGTRVYINYRLMNAAGFEGYGITLGEDRGATNAFLTTAPMEIGQTYHFTIKNNVDADAPSENELASFMAGTMIKTDRGERDVTTIRAGDRVMTRDHGMQTVRWVGARTTPAWGDMAPIAFEAGTLGCSSRLMVTPNTRMLISGAIAELVCGDKEMLISAKQLVNDRNIWQVEGGFVTYVHIMFDYHEVIWANDCPSESFYKGKQAIKELHDDQAREVLAIFPELRSGTKKQYLARAEAHGYEARVIGARL